MRRFVRPQTSADKVESGSKLSLSLGTHTSPKPITKGILTSSSIPNAQSIIYSAVDSRD